MTEYLIHILILIEIYLLLAQGLQMVLGWGGLFNLAHIALFGVGAYTTAILSVDYNWNLWFAMLVSPIAAIVVAYPVFLLSKRLREDYFATGSLALSAVIVSIFTNWRSLTHGVLGIPGIARPMIFDQSTDENAYFIIIPSILAGIAVIVSAVCRRSLFGKFLLAQAEFPEAVSALGVSPGLLRSVTFAFSAVYAGVAGAIFASYMSFIDPTSFLLHEMVFVLAIVVLAGFSSIRMVVFSTAFLVCLPEALRFTDIPSTILGPVRQFLYAAILFLVVFIRRYQLFSTTRRV